MRAGGGAGRAGRGGGRAWLPQGGRRGTGELFSRGWGSSLVNYDGFFLWSYMVYYGVTMVLYGLLRDDHGRLFGKLMDIPSGND